MTRAAVTTPLSWKPVRRDRVYCSPACGNSCTLAEYRAAVAASRALAMKLGGGWKTRVWENLGWHWQVIAGPVVVSRNLNGQYYASVAGNHAAAVRRTPKGAVSAAIDNAKKEAERLERIVSAAELAAGEWA